MTREASARVFADGQALAEGAADWLVGVLAAVPERAAVALSGGSTPRRLYELLAEPARRDRIPWDRVHWFWGDERFVPPDDPASNFGMARNAFLSRVPAPEANIHPIPTTGLSPDESAARYARTLQAFYGSDELDPDRPLFDVNFLGLGEDGHTASLIPGSETLGERTRWVVPVCGLRPETRITLTYPALDSARHVVFLVEGARKRDAFGRVRAGDDLPAARIRPVGQLHWFVDRAAAGD